MGYEHFFGLHDAPFSLAPNPRYLFESASHAEALQQFSYALDRREPLIVMTGDIGTGKTLLCRTVLQRLDSRTFVSVVNNPLLDRDDLLRQMLQDFGVSSTDRSIAPATTNRHDLVHALEDFLSSLIELDARAVVMIDEAQHVQPDVLEQIRLLANIAGPGGTMLQIILAGQLDLEMLLTRPELRQFQQRVSRRIRLQPLAEEELRSYIDHRLAVGRAAGSRMPGADELARALGEWDGDTSDVTFAPDAVRAIWHVSRGLPRVVNLLCDHALEAAYAQRLHTVSADLVDAAAASLDLRPDAEPAPEPEPELSIWQPMENPDSAMSEPFELTETTTGSRTWLWVGVAGVLAGAAVAGWLLTRSPAKPSAESRAIPAAAQAPAVAPVVTPPPAATEVHSSPALPAAEPPVEPAVATPPEESTASFEIVVASFRTDERAASAAAQVVVAGLPVRRREAGGWQQVLAGPFASRDEADAARERLARSGFPGTQIVPASR